VFSRDSSRIPQTVYLTIIKNEDDGLSYSQVHFIWPRGVKKAHVFKILPHIDVVDDLLFYHYPREEMLADGKTPWREFVWKQGRPDGEPSEDGLEPVARSCGFDDRPRWYMEDDGDDDRDQKHPRSHSFLRQMSGWVDSRSKNRSRGEGPFGGSGWHRGESSNVRNRDDLELQSPTPSTVYLKR
jgi:hypothetical protein